MLTGDQIRAMLLAVPDAVALQALSEVEQGRPYEAQRLLCNELGAQRGAELLASIMRDRLEGMGTC